MTRAMASPGFRPTRARDGHREAGAHLLADGVRVHSDSVMKTGRMMVTHEAPLTAGFASEIAATIQKECFLQVRPTATATSTPTPTPTPTPNLTPSHDSTRRTSF